MNCFHKKEDTLYSCLANMFHFKIYIEKNNANNFQKKSVNIFQ